MGRLGALGLVAIAAGGAYIADYGLEGTVVEKRCPSLTVETKLLGIRHTKDDVPLLQCGAIQVGNFVVYHIRSGRTLVYQSEGGRCLFDSDRGACAA